jgi:hypothetical protein
MYTPKNIIEIARIIQAAQIAYQRSNHKATQPSSWKANKEKKIEGLKTLIRTLERVIKLEKLEKNDNSKVLAFMSQEKLRMGMHLMQKKRPRDATKESYIMLRR